MAEDAVQAAPNVYRVLFENERGRFTAASGESVDLELKAGETMWRDAEEHSAKNTGTSDVAALLFELK